MATRVKIPAIFPALRVLLVFALLGQGAVLRGNVLLLASSYPVALAPGAYCPFMSHLDSQIKSTTPHCPMHEPVGSHHAEWHCACGSQSSTSTLDTTLTRFMLPALAEFPAPPTGVFAPREGLCFFPTPFFSPPDPPPRIPFSILA